MATPHSQVDRVSARRAETRERALDHAVAIVSADGVGAVTVSEVARRMGMRPPSLYKHFPSRHALYDALFHRGQALVAAYVDDTVAGRTPGLERLLEMSRAITRWSATDDGRALAPLIFWRPIPGFEPSADAFAPSVDMVGRARADLSEAVRRGELAPAADTDETLRVLTSVVAGICSQQLANEPGADYEHGTFTALTDRVLDMFVLAHSVLRSKEPPP